MNERRHLIYFAHAEDGTLLYIGRTCELRSRLAAHRRNEEWWAPLVTRIKTISVKGDEREAHRLEQNAIRKHRPPFNKAGNPRPLPLPFAYPPPEVPMPRTPLLTEAEAAAQLGLAPKTLRDWRYDRRGLPWVKVGQAVRYKQVEVDRFIDARTVSP